MIRSSRSAVLLAFLTATVALLAVAAGPAAAMSRHTGATDFRGDLVKGETGEGPSGSAPGDPSRDILMSSFNYDASGTVELSVRMAAPIDADRAPLSVLFVLHAPGANGTCERSPHRRITVLVDTSDQDRPATYTTTSPSFSEEPLPRPAVMIDRTRLTAYLTSDRIANLDYVCLSAGSIAQDSSYSSRTIVDFANANVYGFNPAPASAGNARIALRAHLVGSAAKIASILRAGSSEFNFRSPETGVGLAKFVWKVKSTVVATGGTRRDGPYDENVEMKLTSAGKALLKRAKTSVKVTATGTWTPRGAAKVTATQTLTLKR